MNIVLGHIERARREGVRLLAGGKRLTDGDLARGWFVAPTIFVAQDDRASIVRDEVFGPVMTVLPFDDEDDVVARANATEFGLAAGVFTADITRAHRVIARLEAGTCWINQYNVTPIELPFGGYKASGLGRENGLAAIEHYTRLKSVYMPSALSIPMNMARYNWQYETEPEPHLGGRRLHTPRGKVIGGSSSINGMVYVRGNPADFDRWEGEGATGWGYRHVLPYFRRAETRQEGGDAWRGDAGPLHTQYGQLANPLYRAFIDAAREAGYPETADINGYQQEGFGRMDMTVHRGRRWSAASASNPSNRSPSIRR
ncbi:hypothetical protein WR25_25857 [Diploscapter pachys]|uniref:Glucose-methanol-choline oxidoreductase N-terminal domain-containing protein n=1 Tax=Diploscapter pachys TaxID=2018661 RepID=A0A2A2K5C4_9BILA|nr:hypothetical protein WR25_25857 [Diploscapter pachys]